MSKIDTSTTAGKIEVQQAWVNRKPVCYKPNLIDEWRDLDPTTEPVWAWETADYKLRPQTVEEAITEWLVNNLWTSLSTKDEAYTFGFENALKWRDENPKDQDNE